MKKKDESAEPEVPWYELPSADAKPVEPEAAPAPEAPIASVTPIDEDPKVTVDRFIRRLGGRDVAIGSAFARQIKLSGKTIRQSHAAWRVAFEAFKSTPRW
jgi:hypothetical protein